MERAAITEAGDFFSRRVGLPRQLTAWLFAALLLCGLALGQAAGAWPVIDHHAERVSASQSGVTDGDVENRARTQDCHPSLQCSAFVLPFSQTKSTTSRREPPARPRLTQSQLRFRGPPVDLPPPRFLA
ncbi:MAG: hypothetical protein B7Z02_13295 [Rhodobacterales bacterium 32-67-9]|nr:MAG: hypothetical protein B7Z02_13295 [Rhodobacterales bacterium 32-67-9]